MSKKAKRTTLILLVCGLFLSGLYCTFSAFMRAVVCCFGNFFGGYLYDDSAKNLLYLGLGLLAASGLVGWKLYKVTKP